MGFYCATQICIARTSYGNARCNYLLLALYALIALFRTTVCYRETLMGGWVSVTAGTVSKRLNVS